MIRKKFLAVVKACRLYSDLLQAFKGRTFELWLLNRQNLNKNGESVQKRRVKKRRKT